MINYKKENKEYIEKSGRYTYYDFTDEDIKRIINMDVKSIENDDWKKLIQMIYPTNMIGSGLFQPILIFRIGRDGKRIDPPIDAYNGLDHLKDGTCLLFRIIEFIEKNSTYVINESWYKLKEKIKSEGNVI